MIWALLVYDAEEPVRAAEHILLDHGMAARRVRSCAAAYALLQESILPSVVLTDTSLPDGSWADVLKAACTVRPSPPVIVVSRLVDIRLYLDVLESGAYDFIVPPLTQADWAHILRGALLKGCCAAQRSRGESNRVVSVKPGAVSTP
jgi:DNA-binding NtrC family response regulator